MTDDCPLVSIVIPAYNEGSQIEQTLASVTEYLGTIEDHYRWEVVLVDDGSTDDTLEVARAFAEGHEGVRIAPHPTNFDLGQALRYGFSFAQGDYIVTLDADLSYRPDHIGRLLDALTSSEAKIVIASPYMEGGTVAGVPAVRLVASRTANRLLSGSAKGHLTTITGMVRAYDGVFLRRLDLKAVDCEINAEIIYKAQLMRASIAEIPADLEWTRGGEDASPPKFRPSRSIAGFAFVSFLFRPYAYFLIPGAVALVVAIALWIGSTVYEVGNRSISHIVILASMFTILGAILFGMGVLSAQAKRYFEELYHLSTKVLQEERSNRLT